MAAPPLSHCVSLQTKTHLWIALIVCNSSVLVTLSCGDDRRIRKHWDQYLTDPSARFHVNIHASGGFLNKENCSWVQFPSPELLAEWFTKAEQASAFKVRKDKLLLSLLSLGTSQQRVLCPTRQARAEGWTQKSSVWMKKKKNHSAKLHLINRTKFCCIYIKDKHALSEIRFTVKYIKEPGRPF